ncbi:two-component hybrid sensor and regulator [Labilithrix luteola]|uniref:histidine kinase n=1 Tax=Labilithrix luteola TaxID=1391654 RepID=A0A0K1Q4R9_9BACT|nr:GAF domain-containing protein [Labilithrix luteola]AKV00713.1 two-component hybrid sensor and regulator [Labilithrix luteola]
MRTSNLRELLVPAVTTATAAAMKLGIGDPLGREAPYLLLGAAVAISGWLAGPRAALFATALGAGVVGHFLRPVELAAQSNASIQLAVFAIEGLAIVAVVAAMTRAREHARESANRLARLQKLTAAVAATRTLDEVASVLVQEGVEALGANAGTIVVERADGKLEVVASAGPEAHVIEELGALDKDAPFPSVEAFRTRSSQWIENADEYARTHERLMQAVGKRELGAVVALPLEADGNALGGLSFRFDRPRKFPEHQRSLMTTFAAQASQTIVRSKLFAAEAAARRRLEVLSGLADALANAESRQEVVDVVIHSGVRAMGAQTCVLYDYDDREAALVLIGQMGTAPEVLEQVGYVPFYSDMAFAKIVRQRSRIWIENREEYAKVFPHLLDLKTTAPRALALWCLPLVAENRVIGLLAMGHYTPRTFSAEDRAYVETFAKQCAQALRRAQRLEREREARIGLLTILRSIGDAVVTTDIQGRVTLMNPVAERLTGWDEGRSMGLPLEEIFNVVDRRTRAIVESPVERVLTKGSVVAQADDTVLINAETGHETPVDHTAAPLRDENGSIEGVVLVFRDASLKKEEERRRMFLGEVSSTLTASLDTRTILDRVTRVLVPELADWAIVDVLNAANDRLEVVASRAATDEKARALSEIRRRFMHGLEDTTGPANVVKTGKLEFYPDISDEAIDGFAKNNDHARLLKILGVHSVINVPLKTHGTTFGALSLGHDGSGRRFSQEEADFVAEVANRIAIAVDNARLFAAEQQARESADLANRSKDEFLATVSHELRTPLSAILGWSRLLTSHDVAHDKQARAIETIERNAVAMAQLIEDLLDISRIISGKMRLDAKPIDLRKAIEAAIESVRPTADGRKVEIDATLGDSEIRVQGDAARLQQVVWNLLSNAVKFTPPSGRVSIALHKEAGTAVIDVKDTGRGIAPSFLPQVFDPFRQADGTITRKHGGLGLGLAIVRRLVDMHGGVVEANSEGLGRGATFTVRLPRTASSIGDRVSNRSRMPPSASERPPALDGLRVLVVDDDEDMRMLLSTVLEECGAKVTRAGSANEAMAAIQRSTPDVLISDVGMPGEDGYELITKVRKLPPGRGGDVPAAALTAYARVEDRKRALDAGFMTHVPKPVEPDELVSVVAELAQHGAVR